MFDVTLLILLGLAALGFISHNTTVAVSILVDDNVAPRIGIG